MPEHEASCSVQFLFYLFLTSGVACEANIAVYALPCPALYTFWVGVVEHDPTFVYPQPVASHALDMVISSPFMGNVVGAFDTLYSVRLVLTRISFVLEDIQYPCH
ncbi:hypothetical protein DFS33DRAFT_317363 [Desarmillaria ectypa]|nr:hypothetical protein DFS33DRAFT_317363 [Desarmillaria ectypa]